MPPAKSTTASKSTKPLWTPADIIKAAPRAKAAAQAAKPRPDRPASREPEAVPTPAAAPAPMPDTAALASPPAAAAVNETAVNETAVVVTGVADSLPADPENRGRRAVEAPSIQGSRAPVPAAPRKTAKTPSTTTPKPQTRALERVRTPRLDASAAEEPQPRKRGRGVRAPVVSAGGGQPTVDFLNLPYGTDNI